MKKALLSVFALLFLGIVHVTAQNVFYGTGVLVGQSYSTPKTLQGFPSNISQGSQSFLMVGVGIPVDAQLIPVADEMSIGFHIEPAFAYTLSFLNDFDNNIYVLQSPLMAQFNYGNFSSNDASSEFGFGLGLGLMAQFQASTDFNSTVVEEGKSTLFLPTVQGSFRFWGPGNKLYAAKLSYSFGSEDFGGLSNNRSTAFLSLSRYLNY